MSDQEKLAQAANTRELNQTPTIPSIGSQRNRGRSSSRRVNTIVPKPRRESKSPNTRAEPKHITKQATSPEKQRPQTKQRDVESEPTNDDDTGQRIWGQRRLTETGEKCTELMSIKHTRTYWQNLNKITFKRTRKYF